MICAFYYSMVPYPYTQHHGSLKGHREAGLVANRFSCDCDGWSPSCSVPQSSFLGRQQRIDCPSAWAPVTHLGDQDNTPGS